MSNTLNALTTLKAWIGREVSSVEPIRAVLTAQDATGVFIKRLTSTVADAEPYASLSTARLIPGADVLALKVNGKPVVLGPINPPEDRTYDIRAFGTIGTTNDTAVFQAAIAAAAVTGAMVTMPTGTYTLQNPLDIGNARLDLNGSTLDFSTSGLPAYSTLITIEGTMSSLPAMTVAMDRWSDSVTFASAHSLAVGDWFCIYNPADSSFSLSRAYYRDGMWAEVVEVVSSTVVRTRQKAPSIFPTTCTLHKVAPATGNITNGTVVGIDGTDVYGLTARLTAGLQVTNVKFIDCQYAGVNIEKSVDFVVSGVYVHAPMATLAAQDHYGILISNSQHGLIYGNNTLAQSHSVAMGGGSGAGCVPNRWILVDNNHIGTTGSKSAADAHGNAEYVVFRNNVIDGGASIGGDNMVFEGNAVTSKRAAGLVIGEANGLNYSIVNNTFILARQWATTTGALIDIMMTTSSYTSQADFVRNGCHLEIRGNRFRAGGFIPSDSVVLGSIVQIYFANTPATGTSINFSHNSLETSVSTSSGLTNYRFLTVRTLAANTTSIESLTVDSNDFETAGLFTWNADIKRVRVTNNTMRSSVSNAIYIQLPTAAATYAKPDIDIMGNFIAETHANGIYVLAYAAGPTPRVSIRNNTVLDANGSSSASTTLGAGVYVTQASLCMMVGNVWGDTRTTTKQTRKIAVTNTTTLAYVANETVGTVTAVDTSGVTNNRAPV